MQIARAFLLTPRIVIVECGPVELHVTERVADWCIARSGRFIRAAAWGRC